MTKFEYQVLKPFTIIKDSKGKEKLVKKNDESKGGSSFGMGCSYVDYELLNEELYLCPITSHLEQLGYIGLIKKTERKIK